MRDKGNLNRIGNNRRKFDHRLFSGVFYVLLIINVFPVKNPAK